MPIHHFQALQRLVVSAVLLAAAVLPWSAPAAAQPANYQDLWWSGPSENGWGMTITQQGGTLFPLLFVYDAAGNPRWVAMPGGTWNSDFTRYTGSLYIPTGSPFFAYDTSRFSVNPPVGTATLAFRDNDRATLTYTINGITGSKEVVRQTFAAGAPRFNYSDLWWSGPSQNGWGISITQQSGVLFAVWYTYDATGQPVWFVMPGGAFTSANVYAGALYRTSGSPWLGTAYDPAALSLAEVGSLTLTFADQDNASMRYTVGSAAGTNAITRQVFGPITPRPASVERALLPAATDPGITTDLEAHVAINPSPRVPASGRLLVFLPGTGGVPSQYRLILRAGASRGHHALGLNYPNSPAVGTLCGDSIDGNCFTDVRREIITGTDASPLVAVDPSDSIVNRLHKALVALHAQNPAEGWDQYFSASGIYWSRLVVAGHSQGGGHAGVMAKLYSLDRALYFSSPPDWSNRTNAPAAWMSLPNVTPASRQFGFAHERDTLVPLDRLSSIWRVLGMAAFGAARSVDGGAAPFGNTHQLTSDLTPNLSGGSQFPYHGATVVDAATPLTAGGTPRYEPVWAYLLD